MSIDWTGADILAPLTKGGNLPFRRLCVDFGARITVSEMIYSHELNKGVGLAKALLRRHPSEGLFGVQLAASKPEEAARAAQLVEESGADFVDLNCGCPIYEAVKRGAGARLLQKPEHLGAILQAMVEAVKIPVTVKLRLGYKEGRPNVELTSAAAEQAGVVAIAVHGRTREQRYTKAADWDHVARVAAQRKVPVIGNGDVLTFYEARDRLAGSPVGGAMIGRGALIKPWIFQEIKEQRELAPTASERVAIYHRLGRYMLEYFGEDEVGRARALKFLPWHFGFFHRYRPYPEAEYGDSSRVHPLMQTRFDDRNGPTEPLEQLLRDPSEQTHRQLAEIMLDAADPHEACERCANLQPAAAL